MDILTDLQKKILALFSRLPDAGTFYLTGGTALSAFFLKHRKSNDLDFFTGIEGLVSPLSYALESSLKKEGLNVKRARGLHSFIELLVASSEAETVIHLALDSPFRFEPPSESKEISGLKVDNLADIASNKMLALFGRAELRDFIDIYFLSKEHFTRKELIEKASQKDPGFDLYWFGIALERIEAFSESSPDMHLLLKPCPISELKKFFGAWRKEIIREISAGA